MKVMTLVWRERVGNTVACLLVEMPSCVRLVANSKWSKVMMLFVRCDAFNLNLGTMPLSRGSAKSDCTVYCQLIFLRLLVTS